MKRSALSLLSLLLLLAAGSPLRAETAKAEKHKQAFFQPSPHRIEGIGVQPVLRGRKGPSAPNLFRQIGGDFRALVTSRQSVLLVGAGLGSALAARPLDHKIPRSHFNSELYEGTELDRVFEPGQVLGGALVQVGGAFATWGLGKLFSKREMEDLGRDLVRVQILDQAMTQAIKLGAGRVRPDGSNHRSFPSGHASSTFATATVLQRRYGWKVGAPAYGFAAYIAASRLNENRHYLSDVVFGAVIGILAGRTVTVGRGRARFAISPMVVPGGMGVQATLIPRR